MSFFKEKFKFYDNNIVIFKLNWFKKAIIINWTEYHDMTNTEKYLRTEGMGKWI